MGAWYWIGAFAGIGVSLGVLFAGLLAATRIGLVAATLGAVAAAALLGVALFGWPEALAGAVGGLVGAPGAAVLVRGALRRGGTRAGTALLVAVAAAVLAALALVPVLGYAEAVAIPVLAARLRRRAGQTYAGLRILARD